MTEKKDRSKPSIKGLNPTKMIQSRVNLLGKVLDLIELIVDLVFHVFVVRIQRFELDVMFFE